MEISKKMLNEYIAFKKMVASNKDMISKVEKYLREQGPGFAYKGTYGTVTVTEGAKATEISTEIMNKLTDAQIHEIAKFSQTALLKIFSKEEIKEYIIETGTKAATITVA